jgi:hypothetical protein
MKEVFNPEIHEMTVEDARSLHNFRDVRHFHRSLTAIQSRRINQIFWEEISKEGDEITYFKAQKRKPLRDIRHIFLMSCLGNTLNH